MLLHYRQILLRIVLHGVFQLAIILGLVSTGHAGIILNGTLFSDSTSTTIDRYAFSVATAGTVDFDIRSWEDFGQDLNGDGELAFIDSWLLLFRDDGSLDASDLIDANDDDFASLGFGDGSIFFTDSFLSASLTAGNYIVAVAAAPFADLNDAVAAVIAGVDPVAGKPIVLDPMDPMAFPGSDHGDYQLTVTGDVSMVTAVPEPASWVLFAGCFCCAGISTLRRRIRRTSSPVAATGDAATGVEVAVSDVHADGC